ncbi:Maturase K (Intron maturase) [Psidium guajava]|nr:Maturase K (Intron maturase) [Psidium guajava]
MTDGRKEEEEKTHFLHGRVLLSPITLGIGVDYFKLELACTDRNQESPWYLSDQWTDSKLPHAERSQMLIRDDTKTWRYSGWGAVVFVSYFVSLCRRFKSHQEYGEISATSKVTTLGRLS